MKRSEKKVKPRRDVVRETITRAANEVPTNWLDPLLTGENGLGPQPWSCRTIEKLLRGVQDRIRSLAPPARKKP